jgi:pimeloyl-ACP methyl ester carboxylesterase/DNA-binding CsgD family transcriptional regulator
MHQVLDETDAIDDPENFSELEIGDQILSRIGQTSDALLAFGTLLDKSRFKMIILDDAFTMIYHNQNAEALCSYVQRSKNANTLNFVALEKVKRAAKHNEKLYSRDNHGGLCAVEYLDPNGEQLYLRSIHNQHQINGSVSTFYLLLVVDQTANGKELNPDLVERFEFTDKEQAVLINLIHGKNIKEIAISSFVSENTIKTHLKALFRKTDTKSQADIVRLVLTDESQVLDTYFGTKEGSLDTLPPEPSKDKFLALRSGLTIAYRQYGPSEGHPIVVCHNGYGCRVTIPHGYEEMCQRQNKRIIIPDRPGFGLTPFVKDHPNNWNAMLCEFIDTLGLESYDVLGTVLGSVIALQYAVEADSKLKRVRLSSPVFVNTRKDSAHLIGIFSPVSRLIRASERFAIEIYELWLKSVTMNLSVHYRSMLMNGLGCTERTLFLENNTLDLMIEGFQQGASRGLAGISHEMVHCLSPRKVDLSKITVPVDLWWGTQDNRITLEGVNNIASQLNHATVHVREGYSEHIYYALFEDMIS